jgi:hypothetical protein
MAACWLHPANNTRVDTMANDRPYWRFRISSLMLLIIIAALTLALFVEHRKLVLSEQLALANERRAREEAQRARAYAQRALAQLRQAEAQARNAVDEAKGSIPISPRETPK